MAHMNQERKEKIAKNLKPVLAKYGIKGTLSVRNYSTIVLTLKGGSIDFIKNFNTVNAERSRPEHLPFQPAKYINVNPYWYHEHFTGVAKDFLTDAMKSLKSAEWYDESNAQIDYFDTAYYIDINIGKYNKPYIVVN